MSTEAAPNAPPAASVPLQPHRVVDPGAPPQQPVFTRPVLYVQAPPPPPMLQYPWPMPFPYNPFAGFPGMGYGMVMPSFPPPPFMEAPAYVLPHSYMQPVDYRRFNAPGASQQNQNLTRRAPVPPTFPTRGTVNTEVQTEPPHRPDRGYDEVCSDSGRGTASNSPSSSQKQGPAERSSQEKRRCTAPTLHQGSGAKQPAREEVVQSFLRETQETQNQKDSVDQQPHLTSTFQSSHFNMWSQSSDEVPVCSSSQTEDVANRQMCGSLANIRLLNVADNMPPQCFQMEELHEKSESSMEAEVIQGLSRSKHEIPKIRRPPCTPESRMEEDSRKLGQTVRCFALRDEELHSLNTSQEDASEMIPYYMSSSSFHMRRKLNESLWSVESLEPYVPSREWLLQNSLLDAQVIVEMEKVEGDGLSALKHDMFVPLKGNGPTASDRVPVLESRLAFSTPERSGCPRTSLEGEAELAAEKGTHVGGTFSPPPQHQKTSTDQDLEHERASLSEAHSPKPQVVVVIQQQESSPTSPVEVRGRLSPRRDAVEVRGRLSPRRDAVEEVRGHLGPRHGAVEEVTEGARGLLLVPAATSPSKGPSMDCGTQCTDLCGCGGLKDCTGPKQLRPPKSPDVQKLNHDTTEHSLMDRRPSKPWKQAGHWRSRNPGNSDLRQGGSMRGIQQEALGHCGKPGRSKGGTGRTTRH